MTGRYLCFSLLGSKKSLGLIIQALIGILIMGALINGGMTIPYHIGKQ